jgi:hypothetical protein
MPPELSEEQVAAICRVLRLGGVLGRPLPGAHAILYAA